MLIQPPRCWRGRDDCEALHAIEAVDRQPATWVEYASPDFKPRSFICCGLVRDDQREIPQDCYRLCFKSAHADSMTDNDVQDLTHLLAVISQALAIGATQAVNGGTISVPTFQGDDPER